MHDVRENVRKRRQSLFDHIRTCRGQFRLLAAALLALCLTAGCTNAAVGNGQAGQNTAAAGNGQTQENAAAAETADALTDKAAADETGKAAESAADGEQARQKQTEGTEGEIDNSGHDASNPGGKSEDSGNEAEEDGVTEITFTAVGDNLINEVLYGQAAERAAEKDGEKAYDFSLCYEKMAPFIQEHDVNWIDIETLMTDTLEPSGYPTFSTPGDSGRALIDAGWNVFSLASNHTYDQGAYGIGESLAFWDTMKEEASAAQKEADDQVSAADGDDKAGTDSTGEVHDRTGTDRAEEADDKAAADNAEGICCTGLWEYGTEYDIPILTCKGKKLAFLTYTYGTNDIPTPDGAAGHVIYLDEDGLMAYQIQLAHEQADAVIVSLHWGEEYSHCETEEQRELARRVADMGADLIIGGHPHVVQGAEMLTASDGRKVFCAYSLGNFICAQNSMPNPDAMIGLVLSCTFRFAEDGLTVEDPSLIPILSDYGENYAEDHTVLYRDYSQEQALAHGMRTMFGFTQFDYDYVREMLTEVVGPEYLELP